MNRAGGQAMTCYGQVGAEESFSAAQEGRSGAGKRGRGKEGEEGKGGGQLHPFPPSVMVAAWGFPCRTLWQPPHICRATEAGVVRLSAGRKNVPRGQTWTEKEEGAEF